MAKVIGALLVVGIFGAVVAYFYWRPVAVAPPSSPTANAPAPPTPRTEPSIRFPVTESSETKPLPPLAQSDSVLQDKLAGLFGRETLGRFFYMDDIVRRFVATIDNLPRQTTALRLMPVKPVGGAFVTSRTDGNIEIRSENYLRYRPYVQVMEAVEAKKLVAAYVYFYPLFQNAYQELGYPTGYFNDRLVEAIDNLLAAPDVPAPKLVQPKVLYQFADPGLEARSAGQKIMMRMGSANAERVKAKLRAIRRELTGQAVNP